MLRPICYVHTQESLLNKMAILSTPKHVYKLIDKGKTNFTLKHLCLKAYIQCKSKKECKDLKRYNQVPHLTQDTNGKVTYSQLDITNESQEVSPFPEGDHKASIKHAQKHNKNKTEIT